ncbi:hypothetical protein CGRA01v4_14212 [Colletotrichum graminicola]|uniref:Uncharacterized protein n=1 Tax=Colletotrichum graminicola (strain M1.001 / M2 / FGSC 10212) TaxID=645133 RepID=E3Q547_COLGM|nr:uncharacterized protein GLRG_00958 [Colletotrichum graminicola M1.001]EFQ25814.1 hypothetical protein GLRG_00958 [Colletotrichum graminicola M1.001]WDK22921.1 hypothetical protein CGRA01v4_14212 [Colletotrichum graminicola]
MCHGHPRWHPCSHTSINWHYCPSALIDLETGVETPCTHLSYAIGQPSNADCPLLNCQFKALGGIWTCCQCGQGPNDQGWCTRLLPDQDTDGMATGATETCDHGCCAECARYFPTQETNPEMKFGELCKGTASRKFGYSSAARSHRRGSALSKINGFLHSDEKVETTALSRSVSPSRSSVSHKTSILSSTSCGSPTSTSRGPTYKADLEHNMKRLRTPSGKTSKKGHKSLRVR